MEGGEEAEGSCVESTAGPGGGLVFRKRRVVRVQKPRLKIQMLFRATGGRSRRARNSSFARGNMCLLRRRRRRSRLSPHWDNNDSLSLSLLHVSLLAAALIVIVIVLIVPSQLYTFWASTSRVLFTLSLSQFISPPFKFALPQILFFTILMVSLNLVRYRSTFIAHKIAFYLPYGAKYRKILLRSFIKNFH